MKRNGSLAAASVIAALTVLAGCDQQPEQAPLGEAPRYTQDRATPAAPLSDPSADRSAAVPSENPRSLGQSMDDVGITAKVKAALLASNDVDGSAIDVDTERGRVTLKGEVDDAAQIDRAVRIARRIEGVRQVDNQLTASRAG